MRPEGEAGGELEELVSAHYKLKRVACAPALRIKLRMSVWVQKLSDAAGSVNPFV